MNWPFGRRFKRLLVQSVLMLIHTATPDTTKLSRLCRARFGGVNWIPDNSRLTPTESLKSDQFNTLVGTVQFIPTSSTSYETNPHVRRENLVLEV